MGKTLTAISVLCSCVKGGRAKGLIICPSSLIDNWEKEVETILFYYLNPNSYNCIIINIFRSENGWESN